MLLLFKELTFIYFVFSPLDLDSFPQVPRDESQLSPTEKERRRERKPQDYSHETEIIFALPPLQMNLSTKHVQGEKPPSEDGMLEIYYFRFGANLD